MNSQAEFHVFGNGVRVLRSHLTAEQRSRYRTRNLHEPSEEPIFSEAILSLGADDVFLSIGAAIGYYPILSKKLAPHIRVLAVEPLAEFRIAARANLLLNGIAESEIPLHGLVVGGSCRMIELIDMDFGSAALHSPLLPRRQRTLARLRERLRASCGILGLRTRKRLHRVEMITLDRLLAGSQQRIGLCQMDVQGMELEVLQGASESIAARRVEAFLVGTHGMALHESCKCLLKSSGYDILCDDPSPKDQPDGVLFAKRRIASR